MKILELARTLANSGISKADSLDHRHIRVLNCSGALGVVILLCYNSFYFFLDFQNLAPLIYINCGFAVAYATVIVANVFGKHRFSLVLLFAAAFSNITSATLFLGTASGIHMIFIGLAAMALISARADNYVAKVLLILISAALFIFNHMMFGKGLVPEYPTLLENIIFSISISSTVSLVVIPMALYQYYLVGAEKELSQSLSEQEAVLAAIDYGIIFMSPELQTRIINKAGRDLWGYDEAYVNTHPTMSDLIYHNRYNNMYPVSDEDFDAYAVDRVKKVQAGAIPPTEVERADGRILRYQNIVLPDGGRMLTYIDVTDTVLAERNLAEKEAQLRMAMDNMPGAMWVVDDKLNIVFGNDQYANYYGDSGGLMEAGRSMVDVIRIEAEAGLLNGETDEVEGLVGERISSYQSKEMSVFEDRTPDGRHIHLVRKPAADGYVISVATDITERKKAEKAIADAMALVNESINYASRIQRSVLPDETLFGSIFKEYFIIWEPRDVVGGDIYWANMWGNGVVMVLGDCTGHGVPGAFMTLITTGAMDRALADTKEGNVGDFLQHIHQMVQVTLGQHGQNGESDDGMELGVCYFAPDGNIMHFSSARFDLFLVENGEITVIKPTKSGIGYRGIPFDQEYSEHHINLMEGQAIYMTSDGLLDQVGGERGRMFGKKRFKKLLLDVQDISMSEQKQAIHQALIEYQGSENRRDDVAVMGFKF